MTEVADRQHLTEWQRLIGKTVRKQKRHGILSLLVLVFDDTELPLGNGFLGRDFTGDTLIDVSFHHRDGYLLTGDVFLQFGDSPSKRIDVLDMQLADKLLPEDYRS